MKNRPKQILSYQNQWEADEYRVNGRRVATLTKIHIRDKKGTKGKSFMVRAARVSVPYDDMGHEYYGTSTHFFIDLPVVGRKSVEVDLNRLMHKGLDIEALVWTAVRGDTDDD
jgi:hypothetical protein